MYNQSFHLPVSKHDRTQVNVVLSGMRAVNDNRTNESIDVLGRVMRVIPRSTIEFRANSVGEGASWNDGALTDTGCAIVERSAALKESMPVNCSTLQKVVLHRDFNPIAPVSFDERAGELSVDREHGDWHAIWG